jgi:HEPN domain-containing protein
LKFLAKKLGAPTELQLKAAYLTPYFVETRYPDYDEQIPADAYDEKEAKEALKQAKDILDWVEKHA